MNLRRSAPLLLLALLSAGAAAAPLDWFVGEWEVRVRAAGEADFPEAPDFRWSVRPVLGGHWLAGAVIVDGAVFTNEFQGGTPGDLVRRIFAADGSRVELAATDWSGDVLLWTGTLHRGDGPVALRETIRRLGPDRAEAVFETRSEARSETPFDRGGSDGWTPMQTEDLRRVRR